MVLYARYCFVFERGDDHERSSSSLGSPLRQRKVMADLDGNFSPDADGILVQLVRSD